MSPPRKRATYRRRRDRREVAIAVLSSLAIIVVTSVLVWVLRPNKDLGSSPAPVVTNPSATSTPTTAVAPTETTAPAGGTPPETTVGSEPTP
jgi:hypothetical protein